MIDLTHRRITKNAGISQDAILVSENELAPLCGTEPLFKPMLAYY